MLNCWSQSPWFVEFGDEVGVHDVLEDDDAVVDLKKKPKECVIRVTFI